MKLSSTLSFKDAKTRRQYWWILAGILLLSGIFTVLLLTYDVPVDLDSPSYKPVMLRRAHTVLGMLVLALCQGTATMAFQTITQNRIITPSLLGFEALHGALHTSLIYFFGTNALLKFTGAAAFFTELLLMTIFCVVIYGWLINQATHRLDYILLIGLMMGTGLQSMASFMRRMLAPSEFDVLQSRLYGSLSLVKADSLKLALPCVLIILVVLFGFSRRLNVLSLGRAMAISLGVSYRRNLFILLVLVSLLMSISTSLVGPFKFFSFLTASLVYRLTDTYDQKYLLVLAMSLGYLIIATAYFLMTHIFQSAGTVSVIIELFGGIFFLYLLVRRRNI